MVEVKRWVLFVCILVVLIFVFLYIVKDFICEKVYFFLIIIVYCVCLDIVYVMKFDIIFSYVK